MATPAEVSRRRQPFGQDREGPPAWPAESAPDPKAFGPAIVRLAETATVTDVVLAQIYAFSVASYFINYIIGLLGTPASGPVNRPPF
jgi:hypothetical protein